MDEQRKAWRRLWLPSDASFALRRCVYKDGNFAPKSTKAQQRFLVFLIFLVCLRTLTGGFDCDCFSDFAAFCSLGRVLSDDYANLFWVLLQTPTRAGGKVCLSLPPASQSKRNTFVSVPRLFPASSRTSLVESESNVQLLFCHWTRSSFPPAQPKPPRGTTVSSLSPRRKRTQEMGMDQKVRIQHA